MSGWCRFLLLNDQRRLHKYVLRSQPCAAIQLRNGAIKGLPTTVFRNLQVLSESKN